MIDDSEKTGGEALALVWHRLWSRLSSKEFLALVLVLGVWLADVRVVRVARLAFDQLLTPVVLVECALPGLYATTIFDPDASARLPVSLAPPPETSIPSWALVRPLLQRGSAPRIMYLGLLAPLMLLVLAGSLRWRVLIGLALMAACLVGILLMPVGGERGVTTFCLVLVLQYQAILGLQILGGRTKHRPPAAGLLVAVGGLSVVIAAVCIGLSMKAGAITDRALLAPFIERIAAYEKATGLTSEALPPELVAQNAAHLRTVLDRAALAAFASMTALLLHLKSRNAFTFWLVALVWAADIVTANWLG